MLFSIIKLIFSLIRLHVKEDNQLETSYLVP